MSSNTFREDIHQLKKAALYFDLIPSDEQERSRLDTYFGGKPFLTSEKEIHKCPKCGTLMEFIFQLYMPDKLTTVKKLYSFYYCFDCVRERGEGTYAINIYTNPFEQAANHDITYESVIPFCEVKFFPAYELPDFDYCLDSNPEFINKLNMYYGDRDFEVYAQMEERVRDYFNDTGFKIKGYPSFFNYSEIPRCSQSNELMEPFIQMESVPELNMNWKGSNSYFILFKSPTHDEFAFRAYGLDDYEDDEEGWEETLEGEEV